MKPLLLLLFFSILLYFQTVENASFRCDYKFNNATNGWMKFHDVPARWAEARLRCSLEGGTLASPSGSSMRREMLKILKINNQAKKQLFTGLHATVGRGAFYTIEGISMMQFKYTWAENEPDNSGNVESCLTLDVNGDLSDVSCDETFPYICFKSNYPPTEVNRCGNTDTAYKFYEKTKHCYKFHVEPRNFSRAGFACSAEGGHLAIVNSLDEADFIGRMYHMGNYVEMVGQFPKHMFWIGYHDWDEQQTWRTINGQTLKEAGFDTFYANNPNNLKPGQSCGALRYDRTLNDYWCDKYLPFICEKKPNLPEVCTNTPTSK